MVSETEILSKIPKLPGIYIFKDIANNIIYIGKAKNLKHRVRSYFSKQHTDWKVDGLIKECSFIEHILTKNETEALLLEAQMIKEYKPKYNVLLKSGNPFLYILITKEQLPKIKLIRIKKEAGKYFGPFLQKNKVRSTFDYLIHTFKLELCKTEIENGCLDYHTGKCAGNCKKDFDKSAYLFRLELAQKALEDNHQEFADNIKIKIKEHNKVFEFEKSRNLTRYLENIEDIFDMIQTNFYPNKYNKDIAEALVNKAETLQITAESLVELQKVLNLNTTPKTIDCFDISHFQSSYIVGSCIRFTNGVPDKKSFRRFKIKTLIEQNDYAALQEILQRRYRNLSDLPDIVMIDGGKGQLNAAIEVLPNEQNIISLAKREEMLFSRANLTGIRLDLHIQYSKLLIALRDYAHSFAIRYHRLLRTKNSNRN